MNVTCRARIVLIPWLRASASFVITARTVRPMLVKRTMSPSAATIVAPASMMRSRYVPYGVPSTSIALTVGRSRNLFPGP